MINENCYKILREKNHKSKFFHDSNECCYFEFCELIVFFVVKSILFKNIIDWKFVFNNDVVMFSKSLTFLMW